MDWVWFLFEFNGRINRAKVWLAMLVILCWMIVIAILMLGISEMFGNPARSIHLGFSVALGGVEWQLNSRAESVHFSINDIFAFLDPAVLRAALSRLHEGKEASPAHLVLAFFHGVGTLLFVWVYLATSVKRLHDRDKSGWWMLPYFVVPGLYSQFQDRLPDSWLLFPFALAAFGLMIGGFIDIYCLKGTRWTNRFGPNPLPKEQTRARSASRSSSTWDHASAFEFVPRSASSSGGAHVMRRHD